MTSVSARVDLSIVPQARVEGNVRLAERQLLLSLTNTASSSSQTAGSHDLATLLMNEALRMKLTDVDNARLAVRRQFEGAKLLHQLVFSPFLYTIYLLLRNFLNGICNFDFIQ